MPSPVLVSTWKHGLPANHQGWPYLASGSPGSSTRSTAALDAVEQAIRQAEADTAVRSVGRGGYPDRMGRVTLDACIMNDRFECGAVAALEGIVHAVSVARAVMERTDHVLLAGEGALEFALSLGLPQENLMVAETLRLFEERVAKLPQGRGRQPAAGSQLAQPNTENHDTIVTLGLDAGGHLAGACSTSGLMGRMHGRVGDSPIIGAGLYVDGQVGAAGATGHGELALRVSASALVVQRMQAGATPEDACREVIAFVRKRLQPRPDQQLALLALGRDGSVGAASLLPGFSYAVSSSAGHQMVACPAMAKPHSPTARTHCEE